MVGFECVIIISVFKIVCYCEQGLTESGYLLATNNGGEAFELHPDGNR